MSGNLDDTFFHLADVIPFDAVQLLRFRGENPPEELYRSGFSSATAHALAHQFPRNQPAESTSRGTLSPTLSTSEFAGEFTDSVPYREYLATEGYADVMALELYHNGIPHGVIHFASHAENAFQGEPRRIGHAVAGLFSQLTSTTPPVLPGGGTAGNTDLCLHDQLNADPDFIGHLHSFRACHRMHLEHLWWVGRTPVMVSIHRGGNFSVRTATSADTHRLTRQELQVLSVLCCGSSDADIAERLVISPRTVQSHINKVRRKLGAGNRLEAAVIAIGQGIYVPHPQWAPLSQIVRAKPGPSPVPAHP
ncbi:helix-turn-helix transcriptional regulator [Corynebacterium halotolerans]|uniref:helix-turn-helix transcriptional regulator n=1 Tax=Corynebacterium halotolerans TaxID=225326 RepID=UPI003CE85568